MSLAYIERDISST
ncbi:TPR in aerotolerance operon domain protein, partial [Vibrio parahaemolyticus V-223/04]